MATNKTVYTTEEDYGTMLTIPPADMVKAATAFTGYSPYYLPDGWDTDPRMANGTTMIFSVGSWYVIALTHSLDTQWLP